MEIGLTLVVQMDNKLCETRFEKFLAMDGSSAGLDLRLEPVELRLEHRELGFDVLPVGERGLEPAREVAVLGVDLSFEVLPLLLGDSNISLKVQEIDVGGVRGQDCSRKGQAQQREARGSPHHHPKGFREVWLSCSSGISEGLGGLQAAQRSRFRRRTVLKKPQSPLVAAGIKASGM